MLGGARGERPGFGTGLAETARSVLADARHALSETKLSDAESVHEVRKAFKRWRALLRLLRGPIGDPAKRMRAEGRDLMRALAGARDVQGALDALDDLAKGDVALPPRTLDAMRARLGALRTAAESAAFTPERRADIARYLDSAELSLKRWGVQRISFDIIADALTVTYRRARQLVPEDWQDAEADDLHDLRRRVVEHRHQMELVEPLWPRLARLWADEAQRMRNQLGACQDLAVLTRFVAPHQVLAPWRSRLMPAIEARRAAHLRNAARLAGRLFAEKPKAFRARLDALWDARRKRRAGKKTDGGQPPSAADMAAR